MVSGQKNVCQNPKCCENSTKDRYNKSLRLMSQERLIGILKSLRTLIIDIVNILFIFVLQDV